MNKKSFFIMILCLSLGLARGVGLATEELMSRAKDYETEQRWSEAFSAYSEVIKRDPANALAHYRLGVVSEKLGASDQALKSYQEALRLNPGMSEASHTLEGYYVNQGVAQRRNNQLDAAIQSFRQALIFSPSSANVHFELGQTLEQRGQISEAISEYQEAITHDPNKSAAHLSLAQAYAAQGEQEKAVKEYQEVLRLNPQDPVAHQGLGFAYNELGQKDAAIASLQQAVRFYLIAGQRDKARPAYDLQKKLMMQKATSTPTTPRKK